MHSLEVFEERELRIIFDDGLENTVWHQRMSHEFVRSMTNLVILKVVSPGRIERSGHVVRTPVIRRIL